MLLLAAYTRCFMLSTYSHTPALLCLLSYSLLYALLALALAQYTVDVELELYPLYTLELTLDHLLN